MQAVHAKLPVADGCSTCGNFKPDLLCVVTLTANVMTLMYYLNVGSAGAVLAPEGVFRLAPQGVFRLGPEACNNSDSIFHWLWLIVQGTNEYKAPEMFNNQAYVASKVREQSMYISMPVPHALLVQQRQYHSPCVVEVYWRSVHIGMLPGGSRVWERLVPANSTASSAATVSMVLSQYAY